MHKRLRERMEKQGEGYYHGEQREVMRAVTTVNRDISLLQPRTQAVA